jgi:hypothetical protein
MTLPRLQWGRDVSIPEIIPTGASSSPLGRASMGPGCFHPRNYRRSWWQAHRFLASMGPGCFHPRNIEAEVPDGLLAPLQWGRDVSIPEMYEYRRRWSTTRRRFNGAGMFPSQKCGRCQRRCFQLGTGFNGAGMFPSQKFFDPGLADGFLAVLQWGRDVSIPEIATPLLYSIFKDLRARPRALLHHKPTFHSRTILHAANSRRPTPLPIRERSPPHRPRPAARNRLPRRKYRVFRNLPLQYSRQ